MTSPTPAPTPQDLIEAAWGIIANVSGSDWSKQSKDWQEAAARWRENYHALLSVPAAPTPSEPREWGCRYCNAMNYHGETACRSCRAPAPAVPLTSGSEGGPHALSEADVAAIREDAKYAHDAQSRRQIVQVCDSHESLRTALASARKDLADCESADNDTAVTLKQAEKYIESQRVELASARAALVAMDEAIAKIRQALSESSTTAERYVNRIADLQSALDEAKRREAALQEEVARAHRTARLMARLAAETPQFFNPLQAMEAASIRDQILASPPPVEITNAARSASPVPEQTPARPTND